RHSADRRRRSGRASSGRAAAPPPERPPDSPVSTPQHLSPLASARPPPKPSPPQQALEESRDKAGDPLLDIAMNQLGYINALCVVPKIPRESGAREGTIRLLVDRASAAAAAPCQVRFSAERGGVVSRPAHRRGPESSCCL